MDPSHGFLRLDRVVRRLIAEDGFPDTDLARRSIAAYERFFLLAAQHRAGPLVPSRRVDLVWQRHMLDTPAYAEDCARWAGAYLHRDDRAPPGGYERTLGLLGPGDPEAWDGPGPASASADGPAFAGRAGFPGDLDREDLSGVLARVRHALRSKPSASPWVAEARELLETEPGVATEEYRRFLALLMAGAGRIAPCKLVDEFWHQHILDSRNYNRFCARAAGRYLHHTPHYEEPHAFHEPAFRRTLALYRGRWGCDPPSRIWAHLGESGGGGGDGCSSSAGPAPLYAVDTPQHVCAGLRIGRVAPGFRPLHPVLVKKGLPPDLWAVFLRASTPSPGSHGPNSTRSHRTPSARGAQHARRRGGYCIWYIIYLFTSDAAQVDGRVALRACGSRGFRPVLGTRRLCGPLDRPAVPGGEYRPAPVEVSARFPPA